MSNIKQIKIGNTPYDLKDETARLGKLDNSNVSTVQTTLTASKAFAINDPFMYEGQLYKADSAIAQGGTIVISGTGQNASPTTIEALINLHSGSGSGGHTILNSSGTAMTARGKLQFSSKVSDDSGNDKTMVYSGSEETITIGHTTGSSGTNKWLTQNNTIDGTVYGYKYVATLTKPIYGAPKIIRVASKGSGTTDASITAWNCLGYVGLDPEYPTTLNLYASSVPSSDINIIVKWEGGSV